MRGGFHLEPTQSTQSIPASALTGARTPTPESVYLTLTGQPLRATAVAGLLDLHLTTAIYHLRRLQAAGRVACMGGLWYPVGARPRPADLPMTTAQRLLRLVEAEPALDQATAAVRLGASKAAVSMAVKSLSAHGHVKVERHGRRKLIHRC